MKIHEKYVFTPGLLLLSRLLCFHQTFPRWSYSWPMMVLHCCCWGRNWWFPSHMRALYYHQVCGKVYKLMSIHKLERSIFLGQYPYSAARLVSLSYIKNKLSSLYAIVRNILQTSLNFLSLLTVPFGKRNNLFETLLYSAGHFKSKMIPFLLITVEGMYT